MIEVASQVQPYGECGSFRPTQQSSQKSQGPPQKIQPTPAKAWAETSRYPCSYGRGEHYIASCSGFKSLTPGARKEVVNRLPLCYCCMGKHSIRMCQTTSRCKLCQDRHHTMLHQDRSSHPDQSGSASQMASLNDSGAQQQNGSASMTSVPVTTYTHAVDLLIGSDVFGKLIKPSVIKGGAQASVAQLISFGWIIFGPTGSNQKTTCSTHHVSVLNEELHDLLIKFWVREEILGYRDSSLSEEELKYEQHFRQTYARHTSGRYILYSDFLREYADLDHMRLRTRSHFGSSSSVQAETAGCSDEMTLPHGAQASGELRVSEEPQVGSSGIQESYYLPHHGVVRGSSETMKLRGVFNGSAKTSSGKSLNDILHTGAKIQHDIFDVIFWSRLNKDQLIETARQLRDLSAAGGMPLPKWHINSPVLLQWLDPDSTSNDQRVYEDSTTRILGLSRQPSSDNFVFSTQTNDELKVCKRNILSEIPQIYDPLGVLSPVVIRGKLLMQETWSGKLGWDDEVPDQMAQRLKSFRNVLTLFSNLSVPRWLGLLQNSSIEIHGLSDAFTLAMSAIVYLQVFNGNEEPRICLICSKMKVAPLKRLTIARLELMAAVLLARLVKLVKDQLNLSEAPTWKEFIKNRVQLIQEISNAQWKLVPGKKNPADCESRGLTTAQLSSHKLWWQGPPWLMNSSSSWPSLGISPVASADLKEKPGVVLNVKLQRTEIWDLVHRYSFLSELFRVTALCQRFIARFRKVPGSSLGIPLNPGDIEQARLFWIKASQSAYLSTDLIALSRGQKLSPSSPLTRLTAFLDHQRVLRVDGKLKFAQLDGENKHPVIVPKESQFAQLIIKDAHLRTLHGGPQLTLGQLRKSYWILGGRAPVRSFLLNCVACARQRGIRAQPFMGQLPVACLIPGHAFLNTGVDYAVPVSLRSWKGCGHKSCKGWLAIFVCMATPPVHLEVVSDYSAEDFITAYRHFVARRGICRNLFSDCGTNFLGADKEMKKLFSMVSKVSEQLAHLLLNDGTRWSFNPPGAPHFGGKWEAAVKSVKFHLNRTIGDAMLTFE
ncbi:uncharacterized protein LOC107040961 [Diachasma alloeum]|uniref:uncharacterized protein LOC107040961 n=1 Tax=Diachasma alloeum TaxID=454923 RepID=UPI00073851A1|nr:uncharacterized protein LOC107040961 [Diachasma alloeum]